MFVEGAHLLLRGHQLAATERARWVKRWVQLGQALLKQADAYDKHVQPEMREGSVPWQTVDPSKLEGISSAP